MALFNVTNLFDSGVGSLRQAILDANFTAGADEIQFSSISGKITLTSGELKITDSLTINGIGADLLTVSGNDASRVFNIDDRSSDVIDVYLNGLKISQGNTSAGGGIFNAENLTLTNSVISNNYSVTSGGGIFNAGVMTITNSKISKNGGNYLDGGGISNSASGKLTITDSTISNNRAYYSGEAEDGSGGGIYNQGEIEITNSTISGNFANFSGGIFNDDSGTATIINSTISRNFAEYNGGGIQSFGKTTITNSTISGNRVYYNGGGIDSSGELIITNSTISDNRADNGGGINSRGQLNIANTIIANNTDRDCSFSGTITTNINNLIEDGTCNPTFSGDPNLGPLQDNGGPTFTQALLPGSIAIDAGSNAAIPPGITTDQRGPGFPRIINGTVDIGAYEASQNVPPTVPESSSLFGVLTLGLVAVVSWRRRRK